MLPDMASKRVLRRSKYRNLVIIGNGFDRWQGLPTSYDSFRQFYRDHADAVLSALHFPKYEIPLSDGTTAHCSAADLVYGDPFRAGSLPDRFFWNFEASLDRLDDQLLNQYFGRSQKGIASMRRMVRQAQKTLREVFCRWVASIDIPWRETDISFPDDCFFINFNYTDTLQRRFGISPNDIYHIHGSAKQPESIVVGHASHPETAFPELIEQQFMTSLRSDTKRLPRFEGLYAVEELLYQTDKHVEDRIDALCATMMERGVHMEDFESIYVLGHSFAAVDYGYFSYLDKVTRYDADPDELSALERMDHFTYQLLNHPFPVLLGELYMEYVFRNLEYAVHHRERVFADSPSLYPELDEMDRKNGVVYDAAKAEKAVQQRFLLEQAKRTQRVLDRLSGQYHAPLPGGCHSVLGYAAFLQNHAPRRKNAAWHISCFCPEDRLRVKDAMARMGERRYTISDGIDACIAQLRAAARK